MKHSYSKISTGAGLRITSVLIEGQPAVVLCCFSVSAIFSTIMPSENEDRSLNKAGFICFSNTVGSFNRAIDSKMEMEGGKKSVLAGQQSMEWKSLLTEHPVVHMFLWSSLIEIADGGLLGSG